MERSSPQKSNYLAKYNASQAKENNSHSYRRENLRL